MNDETINFKILHMDGLGQGVSKDGEVTFIEKVLPGEEGTAEVYRKAKGVRFAMVKEITVKSEQRIEPACSMFSRCGGCQYLHTSYKNERALKELYLQNTFQNLVDSTVKFSVYPAEKRFGYRNRVQLHYNIKTGQLGYISKFFQQFIPASACLLPVPSVRETIQELYSGFSWKALLPPHAPETGIIEIYHRKGKEHPTVSINTSYAEGGFSQVNTTMNRQLAALTTEAFNRHFNSIQNTRVLDIFGGNGNLTSSFHGADIIVADLTPEKEKQHTSNRTKQVIVQDLYRKEAVQELYKKLIQFHGEDPHLIVFDPPRKGVKNIRKWISRFSPDMIFYISCNPATLKRDAETVKSLYKITDLSLIDLFPGTKHFETFAVFKKIEPSTESSASAIVV